MFKPAQELVLDAKKSVRECTPAEIQQRIEIQDNLILDVREPEEFKQGFIAGALNIPRGLLEFRISGDAALQNIERPIVVYCKSSGRAALAVATLQSMGFRDVVSLAGGFDAWLAEGSKHSDPAD